jgi:hypothetical protein
MAGKGQPRRKDAGAAQSEDSANRLLPERHAALMAQINRIAEAKGYRRAGVTQWEAMEEAAGLKRGALWGARRGSRTQPETLAAFARWAGESPWHLINAAYGLTHQDGLQYLREWEEREQILPEIVERTRRYVCVSEEDRRRLADSMQGWLQSWLGILRPPSPGAAPMLGEPPAAHDRTAQADGSEQ